MEALILGLMAGMLVGPVSVFVICARDYRLPNAAIQPPEWSRRFAALVIVVSLPAAVNSAIGAISSVPNGRRKRFTVTVFPVLFHVLASFAMLLYEPQSVFGLQGYLLIFTVVIWAAGRIGQRVGTGLATNNLPAEVMPSEV